MTTALVLFPRSYWPARLAVSLSLVAFMLLFAVLAHVPDDGFRSLPPVLRHRLDKLVHAMCRSGDRAELMRGTFYYAFAVATFVLLFWTAPINVVIFASLFIGDGLADPVGRLWASCAEAAAAPPSAAASPPATTPPPPSDDGKSANKPLLFLQYRVGHFGVKSLPGSLAFFLGATAAAAMWGALFSWAGHYGPQFELATFLPAAALCIAAATVAEAIVRATPTTHRASLPTHTYCAATTRARMGSSSPAATTHSSPAPHASCHACASQSPPHVDNLLVTYAAAAVAFCLNESGYAPYMLATCG